MTAPLDEARLRELAEAVRDSRTAYDTAAVGNSAALWRRFESASDDLDGIIQPVEMTILALLDALSAERQRGDRAVKHLTAMSHVAPRSHEVEEAHAFLATQKAEEA